MKSCAVLLVLLCVSAAGVAVVHVPADQTTIRDGIGAAIVCLNGSRAKTCGNVIHDNQTHASWGGGVIYGANSELEITGNTLHSNTGYVPGIALTSGPSKVWHNVIHSNDNYNVFSPGVAWSARDSRRLRGKE